MDDPKPSKSKHSKQRKDSVLVGVLKIAAAANVSLEEATQAVYVERLLELDGNAFMVAVTRTIDDWDRPSLMPPLPFILARSGASPQLQAEQDYAAVMKTFEGWYPDLGQPVTDGLPPAAQYALRQIGGFHRIAQTKYEDVDFQRRAFMEAHQRFTAEGGAQQRYLTHGEAKGFLDELKAELPEWPS